tara:strand:- start:1025 stop:1762 length:738 start_codon:yes stop_codon:yes gene_type:complete
MKFNILIIFIIFISCSNNYTKISNKTPYNSKGFAYIYKDLDNQIDNINVKLDNTLLQIAHNKIKTNSLIKIINPKTKDSIVVKNSKKINYPDFYKIIITEQIAEKLNLDKDLPLVEIIEIKKNKSFVAKKAKMFNEEKKISSNAPVTSVQISNISKNKDNIKKKKIEDFYILIGTFYTNETAVFLKERIAKEIPAYDIQKLKIIRESNNKINLISGSYSTINLMKNDYIDLKNFGFEELDIIAYE